MPTICGFIVAVLGYPIHILPERSIRHLIIHAARTP
jgi:hypothetical protein